MSVLSPPKNLTKNVLLGMAAGVLIASVFYYTQDSIPEALYLTIEKYVFNLGGQIFKNLLIIVGLSNGKNL